MNKFEFIKSLPKREAMYIILSRLTRLPYVACNGETFEDEVFGFTEEAEAIAYAKELCEDGHPVSALKIEQKDLPKYLAELFAYGVTALVVRAGSDVLSMELSEVVRRPSFDKLPEKMRPLENPALQLSMIYYLQEARKGAGNYDTAAVAEQEEEMAVNLLRSKYILPVKEVEVNGQKMTQLLLMKAPDKPAMVPIFSDVVEFGRFQKDGEAKAAVVDFEKMAQMPLPEDVEGFMLNPASSALVLSKEYIKKELQLNR